MTKGLRQFVLCKIIQAWTWTAETLIRAPDVSWLLTATAWFHVHCTLRCCLQRVFMRWTCIELTPRSSADFFSRRYYSRAKQRCCPSFMAAECPLTHSQHPTTGPLLSYIKSFQTSTPFFFLQIYLSVISFLSSGLSSCLFPIFFNKKFCVHFAWSWYMYSECIILDSIT